MTQWGDKTTPLRGLNHPFEGINPPPKREDKTAPRVKNGQKKEVGGGCIPHLGVDLYPQPFFLGALLRMHLTPCLGSHTPLTPGEY